MYIFLMHIDNLITGHHVTGTNIRGTDPTGIIQQPKSLKTFSASTIILITLPTIRATRNTRNSYIIIYKYHWNTGHLCIYCRCTGWRRKYSLLNRSSKLQLRIGNKLIGILCILKEMSKLSTAAGILYTNLVRVSSLLRILCMMLN